MRFVTFETEGGVERFGFLSEAGRVVDLEGASAAALAAELPVERAYRLAAAMAPSDALAFVENGETGLRAARDAKAAADAAARAGRKLSGPRGETIDFAGGAVRLKAPFPRPRNFIACGKNFDDHLVEMQQSNRPVAPRIPSGHPQYPSAIVGPDSTVPYPKETRKLDYEVEMAYVIGRRAFRIRSEQALDHVFGFTIYNDLSARDLGEQEYGVPLLTKNLPGFAPMGPYLVTCDEFDDLDAVGLRTRVNGELRQASRVANMRFKIRDQIAFWSQIGLEPGDVLTTGTPGGVAAGRGADEGPWWLKPGDAVECEVDGIGILRTRIG
ncbi:MAG: fumarylacetoacetate hydrolase family protein [Rhodospirillales bacterium]|nr:fumarylacetoacetate hydrolase family protein [Rhodospirillales bacterium]